MTRGDIITIADPAAGDFARKPRPAIIVQSNSFLEDHHSISVCLITSQLLGFHLFRVPVPANEQTGLLKPSEVSIDKVQTVWRHRVGRHLGRVPDEIMFSVDQALRRWLAI